MVFFDNILELCLAEGDEHLLQTLTGAVADIVRVQLVENIELNALQRHSHHQQVRPYDSTTNTADYPSACQASYNPERAKDQLDTLLKAGHITHEEYRLRIDQLKNYKHC